MGVGPLSCGYGEELVVLAKGSAIQVKLGAGEPALYPLQIHLPAGRLQSPGEPFLRAKAAKLG